jgi:cell division protein FtsW
MQRQGIYLLLLSVVGLVALGVVMLFSTSAFAQESHGDIYYFVKKDAIWLVIGIGVCIAGALTDYHFWQRTWNVWFVLAAVLLTLCFVPHVGMRINGSHRWINLGVTPFQPSELGKLGALFFLCWWFSRPETDSRKITQGLIYPVAARLVTTKIPLPAMWTRLTR